MVKVVGGYTVVTVGVLELTKVVQSIDLLKGNLMVGGRRISSDVRSIKEHDETYTVMLLQVR